MFIPLCNSRYEYEVDRSIFIAYVYRVGTTFEIDEKLKALKTEHNKAKHILYAYKINEMSKSNDDNEPGAISKSFLELINKNDLNNTLIVVVRYFGGVLLGASRLLRTYLNTANEAIKGCKLGEVVEVYRYLITTDYSTFNKIKNARYRIENVVYFDKIKLEVISRDNIIDNLKSFKLDDIKVTRSKEII